MKPPRSLRAGLLAIGGALLAAGCTDAPSAPALQPTATTANLELVSPSVVATGITRDVPLARNLTTTLNVPAAGGNFEVPGTGLRIIVPGGALRGNGIKITVTALAGPMIAYNFEPHGTVFALPLLMSQDVAATSYTRLSDKGAVEVGYFSDNTKLDTAGNQALIGEFLPASPDWTGKHLRFHVRHFSGYMVASGRTTLK